VSSHPVAVATNKERSGVVENGVDDGARDHLVGKDSALVGKVAVGGQVHRAPVEATADHWEDPVGQLLSPRQVPQLVDDQQRGLGVGGYLELGVALEVSGLQGLRKVRARSEVGA